MIRLMVLLLLASPMWGAYAKKIPLTIQTSQVVSGPHTDFTFYIDTGSVNDLRTTGNYGFVTSSSGYDIVLSQDADCSTKLNFRREYYVASSGRFVAYGLKSSFAQSDTIYICFADSGVTTDQANPTAAYASSVVAVYHFADGSTLDTTDGTANANNASSSTLTAAAGKIGTGSAENNGSQSMSVPDAAILDVQRPITIEGWYYSDAASVNLQDIVGKGTGSIYGYRLTSFSAGKMSCQFQDSGGSYTLFLGSTTTFSNGTWYHVACTCDATTGYLYINGVQEGTNACTGTNNGGSSNSLLVGSGNLDGKLDDVKIHNVARSAGWITTTYNMGTQSTFWTIGATQDNATAVPRRRIIIQ